MRDTFPHATTWLGPYDLVMVASRKPLNFDAQLLAARMARPDVKADLARVDIHDVFALLSKQVHSEQGQLEFAGQGPINTDDDNILEYASPIAFFVGSLDRYQDERRAPDGGPRLFVHDYVRQHPPTAEQLELLYRNMARYHRLDDPLVRGVAASWRAAAPDSRDAAVALAKAALAQNDLSLSSSLLEAEVARGGREPALVAAYLEMATTRLWATRTVWTPAEADAALALGREVARAHPEDTALADALKDLCKALPAPACAAAPPAPVASPDAP
jgi:hypothetical protein